MQSIAETINITEALVLNLIKEAEIALIDAKTYFNQSIYVMAYHNAKRSENLIENAEELIDQIEYIEGKDWGIIVEVSGGKAYIEIETCDINLEFTLDTANREYVIEEIITRTGLSRFEIEQIIVFEFDEETIEEIHELIYDHKEALNEVGESYLKIFDELNETVMYIEEKHHEITKLKVDFEALDIDPELKSSLFVKLDDALNTTNQSILFVEKGLVFQVRNLFNETDNILNAFIIKIEANDAIYGDDAEDLIENAQDLIGSMDDEIEDLIEELEYILIEINDGMAEVHRISAELEDLGVEIEVVVKDVNSFEIVDLNYYLYGLKYGAKVVFVKPAVYVVGCVLIGYTAYKIIDYMVELNIEQEIVIFAAAEDIMNYTCILTFETAVTEAITADSELTEGFKGNIILSLSAGIGDVILVQVGLGIGCVVKYSRVLLYGTGMDELKGFDRDFGWTHTLPIEAKKPLLTELRLQIRAFDVDWGPSARWEHNRIYANNNYVGTLTGYPPRRWNNQWSTTTFFLCVDLVKNNKIDVWVNIDSSTEGWVVHIDESVLRSEWVYIKRIDPHLVPILSI